MPILGAFLLPWATPGDPLVALNVLILLLLAADIARTDPWLGAFVVYGALWGGLAPVGYLYAQMVAFGAYGVTQVRRLPDFLVVGGRTIDVDDKARLLLVAAAIVQVGYACLQERGVDPLWRSEGLAIGSLGNPNWLGAYLAMIFPLAPRVGKGVVLLGIILARHKLGVGAALLGALAAGCASDATIIAGDAPRWMMAVQTRTDVWLQGLMTWAASPGAILFGHGPGSWSRMVPGLQARTVWRWELLDPAHNEYLNLLFCYGLVGVFLALGWVRHHWRRLCASRWRGSAAALMILCCGLSPFHVSALAWLGVVILGRATAKTRTEYTIRGNA